MKSLLARLFHVGQRLGWDILPRHFYSEIPDIRKLRDTMPWRQPYSMIDVPGADLDQQVQFVQRILPRALRDRLAGISVHADACARNGEPGYGRI